MEDNKEFATLLMKETKDNIAQGPKHRRHPYTVIIDYPSDGHLKIYLRHILSKLDARLGTTYVKQVGKTITLDELILAVARIMEMHNVRVLVKDKRPDLANKHSFAWESRSNFHHFISRLREDFLSREMARHYAQRKLREGK